MRDGTDKAAAGRRAEILPYVLTVGAVVLAWQIAIQPLMQRAPIEAAVRLAAGSPLVLRRAAESELLAGRVQNAAVLSREALIRAPFDARTLRILGLTEARSGQEEKADEILTLAGNWSLRDDPTHAWLVERRLQRGDYASSFAHADTLVRRRQDMQPQVFKLFTAAGMSDPQRSLPVIAHLLAARPPWRSAYLASLYQTPQELQLAANLAILLEPGRAPLTNFELQSLYRTLLSNRQLLALNTVRGRLNRPPPNIAVTNGGFADPAAPDPFQWRLMQKAGITSEIVFDDLRHSNPALRVDYNGYAIGAIAEQLTSLEPGAYKLAAEVRTETGNPTERLAWTLACAPGGEAIASVPAGALSAKPNTWATLAGRIEVPEGCPAQWLQLVARPEDYRSPTVAWFDNVTISPVD